MAVSIVSLVMMDINVFVYMLSGFFNAYLCQTMFGLTLHIMSDTN